MSRHQVGVCSIGTLNNIVLARIGPVGSIHPDYTSRSAWVQEKEEESPEDG